ncbi:carboxypeptidase-like regulatory domain-containing protein [Marinifilum sp.]|uniref:carboxypeptidase-like regulatory domain-containing protein n=1 Tax=Marinifilum sp. TaxID=2033137 RepID=UPI003BAB2F44
MRIFTLFFAMLLMVKVLSAQNTIECKIVDVDSNESLPYANVFLPKYSIGTSTDDKGIFHLQIEGKEKHDTVIISYIGYDSRVIQFGKIFKQQSISLKPIVSQLLTVEVIDEKQKLNAKKIAMSVIELYHKNRPKYTHLSKCQAAQYIKIDRSYCFYMESLGYAIYSGDVVTKNPLVNYKFFAENTCLADRKEKILHTVMKKTGNNVGLQSNLGNGLRSFQILNYYGVLNPKHAKKYSFKIDSIYKKKQEYYYSISFKRGKSEGKFLFHRESLQLISLEQKSEKIWSVLKYKNVAGKEYYTFNYFDEKPFFNSIKCEIKKGKLEEQTIISNKFQKATNFDIDKEVWCFNSYSINPFIIYSPKAWSTTQSLFDDRQSIVNDLKDPSLGHKSLEYQYMHNCDKWFENDNNQIQQGKIAIQYLSKLLKEF